MHGREAVGKAASFPTAREGPLGVASPSNTEYSRAGAMAATIHVDRIRTSFDWPEGASARIWILQPDHRLVPEHPPWAHPVDDAGAWPLLQKTAELAGSSPDPCFIVVPELCLAPSLIPELRALVQTMPTRVALVAGMGHLNQEQCDEIEPGVDGKPGAGSDASRWLFQWRKDAWANGALVGVDGRTFLEAKRAPSSFEQQADCHHPHCQVRLFEGATRTFAVVICSEMLADQPDELAEKLRAEHPDVVFWLQHNPSPRHELLRQTLATFFAKVGDHPLIVCANKRPDPGERTKYGASAIAAPAACFSANKYRLHRPGWTTEPIADSAARAVLLSYDASALLVRTLHPSDVPAGTSFEAKAGFLEQVIAHDDHAAPIGRAGAALEALFDAGDRLLPPSEPLTRARAMLGNELQVVRASFTPTTDRLLHFLDRAWAADRVRHARDESHPPAAACDCWEHRRDFDSLFGRAGQVMELLLAIAALSSVPGAAPEVVKGGENLEFRLAGSRRRLLMLLDTDPEAVARHLKALPSLSGGPYAIALEARPSPLPIQAIRANSRPTQRLRSNAARSGSPAVLWGDDFWQAVPAGTLERRLKELYGTGDGDPGGEQAA